MQDALLKSNEVFATYKQEIEKVCYIHTYIQFFCQYFDNQNVKCLLCEDKLSDWHDSSIGVILLFYLVIVETRGESRSKNSERRIFF